MTEASITLPPFGPTEWAILWAVLLSGIAALVYGAWLVRQVLAEPPGTARMVEVARAVEEGSMAYLGRQVRTMVWLVAALALGLFALYAQVYTHAGFAVGVAAAFVLGVAASYGAGYVGMWLAVKGNVRSANA